MQVRPFPNPAVAQAFEACPAPLGANLLALRELIFRTAAETPGVGEIEETLKWGEPAYVTTASKSGSTIRIGWKKPRATRYATRYAIYFHCQTNLVETFRTLFPGEFEFEGNRALVFDVANAIPKDALALCIAAALTYHQDKAAARRRVTR